MKDPIRAGALAIVAVALIGMVMTIYEALRRG